MIATLIAFFALIISAMTAWLVNSRQALVLSTTLLQLSEQQSTYISKGSGVYFDWGPDSESYHAMSIHGQRSSTTRLNEPRHQPAHVSDKL